jgi:hypothetical protein
LLRVLPKSRKLKSLLGTLLNLNFKQETWQGEFKISRLIIRILYLNTSLSIDV